MSKEKKEKIKNYEKKTRANYARKTDKKEKNPWKNIKQVAATICKKDSNGLKSIEVYVETNFAKYKVENFSDTDIYTDEDDNGDYKENRITWFI